ncbi:hypothetical protein NQ314_001720 [Rhamnusium bicolor]|uniref:L1 transposable element RRM domain-containing protein n=1 Tax=Rhamnusium bicolor TaxID=1586634 RepID=A0AAV8ZR56_9CUCU|nr:hypothetical protein NQ314_001720 [Rhamnusium bicolor]
MREKLDDLNKSLSYLSNSVNTNEKSVSLLNQKVDTLEQAIKNKTIRICGLVEEQERDSVTEQVIQLFTTKLGVACREEDFSSIFRIGRHYGTQDKPRTIVVKFVRHSKRSEILKAKNFLKIMKFQFLRILPRNALNYLKLRKRSWDLKGHGRWTVIFMFGVKKDRRSVL